MKEKKRFKPQDLRSILSVLLVLVVVGGAAVFYLGLGMVRDYAEEVNQRLADAEASGTQVEELQVLKNQLSQSDSLIQKTNKLFSTPGSYQSQALSDIRAYADDAGLTISGTNFEGEQPNSVTITLASPASYQGLITFLTNIESNLPKMQVTSISLEHVPGGSADSVGVDEINIEISVR